MTSTLETYEFKTEARQVLDLMVHSVYSNKDIFLRELISNSSDALDKRRFEALKNRALSPTQDYEIWIAVDKEKRTLSVSDNGIGMTREEVKEFIGTIAKSGAREFVQMMRAQQESGDAPQLIGQFGVGFYAAFMAADRVELVTRKAGESVATRSGMKREQR